MIRNKYALVFTFLILSTNIVAQSIYDIFSYKVIDIPHDLDRSKIAGISILVTTIDGVNVGPGYFVTTGLLYNFQINANNVRINNPLLPIACGLVVFRPVRIFITYME